MSQPLYDTSRSAEAGLIQRALNKDEAATRAIIGQHNRRLFRVARGIVRDDGDAEDVLQEAYLRAFSTLSTFRGDSSVATWLTRIVVNEALQRLRRHVERPIEDASPHTELARSNVVLFPLSGHQPMDPERIMAQHIYVIADALGGAIAKQFPDKFAAK